MTELLEQLKTSLQLDDFDDDETKKRDALLLNYLAAAESSVKNAITTADDSEAFFNANVFLLNTVILAVASSYYLNRSVLSSTSVIEVDFVYKSIVAQLRGRYEAWREEHGTNQSI